MARPLVVGEGPLSRPKSSFQRQIAAIQPPFLRRLTRMPAGQLAFSLIGFLVICSMVAGTLATVGFDASNGSTDIDPTEFSDRTDELIEQQRQRVEENPRDAGAMALLGSLLANDGQVPEAVRWYESALRLNPNDIATRLSFARQLALGDRPFDAELQYQRALEMARVPAERAQAEYGLAQLYEGWNPPRLEEAMARYAAVANVEGDLFISEQARQRLAELQGGTPTAP